MCTSHRKGTRGCVVGTVARLLPDDGGIVARFRQAQNVQTGSGAHPASYWMGAESSFPTGKAAGTCSCLVTSLYLPRLRTRGAALPLTHVPSRNAGEGGQLCLLSLPNPKCHLNSRNIFPEWNMWTDIQTKPLHSMLNVYALCRFFIKGFREMQFCVPILQYFPFICNS